MESKISDVYYIDFKKVKKSILNYIDDMYKKLPLKFDNSQSRDDKGYLIAIKLHMGEIGNTSYVRPIFIRKIVENLKKNGYKPFLTDTSTLYVGQRSNAVDYLNCAVYNGFGYDSIGCPIIISDGIRSNNFVKVETPFSKYFKYIKYAGDVAFSDGIVVISHVKGHMLAGFGGALKNLAMGLATRSTKQQMHGDVKPQIKIDNCIGCGLCYKYCPVKAIKIINKKAQFDLNKCIGCGDCITICQSKALRILWNESKEIFLEKMGDVIRAILNDFNKPKLYFNFLMDITPDCDCMDYSRYNITSNIGILASYDPVAIDQASIDLVQNEKLYYNFEKESFEEKEKEDKFALINDGIDYRKFIEYCEIIGLGNKEYKLISLN
ncbi:MAG: DUF362 domain-containing protein [Exilispira sp.]